MTLPANRNEPLSGTPTITQASGAQNCWRCRTQRAAVIYNGLAHCRRCFYVRHTSSSYWERLYDAKRLETGGRCEACGTWLSSSESRRAEANLHHVTYRNLGHESLADVELLCRPCHEGRHGR